MSAQHIYVSAPLGSIIRYSDGAPKPPARFKRKLAAWENNNSGGRLVRKTPSRDMPSCFLPASITLHRGDFGSAGVVVLRVYKTFSVIRSDQHSGMTECIATLGGNRNARETRRYLVPSDEYHVGRFGFVIDEARHRLYAGPSSLIGWNR